MIPKTVPCLFALALAACTPTPTPAHTRDTSPAPPPSAASTSGASASASAPPAVPPLPPDGCWSGAEPGADAGARAALAAVSGACIQGMQPVAPQPLVVELDAGGRKELPFTVTDASRCVRAAAAGGPGVTALTLSIIDRRDSAMGSADLRGAFAVVAPAGPLCLPSPGVYRAVARVVHGKGRVAIQAWQAPSAIH